MTAITLTARDARPGDVVLDTAGVEWKRGAEYFNWSTFGGVVGYEGPWDDTFGPQGKLTLLVRDGQRAG